MSLRFYGVGKRYYGHWKLSPTQSCITTEWLTLVNIPLVPLRSLRLVPRRTTPSTLIAFRRRQKTVVHRPVERLPLCWPQVLMVYALAGVLLFLLVSFAWLGVSSVP